MQEYGYSSDMVMIFQACFYTSVFSYMDKEEYDEAVRDYEKVYQTEKTKGMSVSHWCDSTTPLSIPAATLPLCLGPVASHSCFPPHTLL